MTKSLRILYYNWVDYLDIENRGGGVSVYQRNLMTALQDRSGVDVTFLSSGLSYDLPAAAPRWEQVRHGVQQDRSRRYEIVNSGVLAPGHHAYGDPAQLEHAATVAAFFDFIEHTGPYDVIHFNNLEGLPVSALALKERWPHTQLILSLHNYYFSCPQVNLWHQERETCDDNEGGRKCAGCLPEQHNPRHIRIANGLSYRLRRLGLRPDGRAFRFLFVWSMRLARRLVRLGQALRRWRSAPQPGQTVAPDVTPFVTRRARIAATINRHCDRVLCVSDAVRRIAVHHGIDPTLTHTSYIGTREADAFAHTAPTASLLDQNGMLTLGYLGYMRRDKGFYFLLDALERLPDTLAQRIRLMVAARRGDAQTMERLEKLRTHLGGITYADGYSHDDLDPLLKQVDVGVIPVLWHDNLPQVAIEMHARHIPLLTADMGGAQELGNCPDMVFPAGNVAAFHDRVSALLEGRVDMHAYWQSAKAPTGMGEHVDALLLEHYSKNGRTKELSVQGTDISGS